MNLEDTATSSDPLTDTFTDEVGPAPVPADYGGILDPRVRGDESGNVQTLDLKELLETGAEIETTQAAEDPYYRGYREAERDFRLREVALVNAISLGGTSNIVVANAEAFHTFLRGTVPTV
jgi:hypothetical protein